jgi:hypothetical protein
MRLENESNSFAIWWIYYLPRPLNLKNPVQKEKIGKVLPELPVDLPIKILVHPLIT